MASPGSRNFPSLPVATRGVATRRAFLVPLLLIGLSASPDLLSSASATPNLRNLRNLGISGDLSIIEEPWLVIQRDESNDGVDFNGDGDLGDNVLYLYDLRTDQGHNLALAGSVVSFDPPLLTLRVSEQKQGRVDLNGDGDAQDDVIHYYNVADGSLSTVLLAGTVIQRGSLLILRVKEDQVTGDLNGDGDVQDGKILHLLPVGTLSTTNVGIVADDLRASEDLLAFVVPEEDQGSTDLNGDGDLDDEILHVFNMLTGQIVNLGFSSGSAGGNTCATSYNVGGPLLYIPASEASDDRDYNQDGDLDDDVVFVYDARSDTLTPLEVATRSCNGRQRVIGNRICFVVNEFDQGFSDLNGDGDIFDDVIYSYDASAGELTNLGLAGEVGGEDLLFAIEVDELNQDLTDLNGDGDFLDHVQHVLDPNTGVVTNLALASKKDYPTFERTRTAGRNYIFRVDEKDQGFVDLNGNGIVHGEDDTLFAYNVDTGQVTNLGIVDDSPSQHLGPRVLTEIVEGRQAADLNRDGDRNDRVHHLYDEDSGIVVNLGIHAFEMHALKSSDHVIGFSYYERSLNQDLNGDGDLSDDVIHISTNDTPYGKGTRQPGSGPHRQRPANQRFDRNRNDSPTISPRGLPRCSPPRTRGALHTLGLGGNLPS